MEKRIIPCNEKYYDVEKAFSELKILDWKQSNKSMQIGDIVYIYVSKPYSEIRYKCKITKVLLDSIEISDSEYIIDGSYYEKYLTHMELTLLEKYNNKYQMTLLREYGIHGSIQSPRKVTPELTALLDK